MKILFIGDVYGELGRIVLEENLQRIKREEQINIVVCNGENAAHGKGITKKIYKNFLEMGVTVVTMGNHTFDNQDIRDFIDEADKLVVPCNYPKAIPGNRYCTFKYNDKTITVINVLGTIYMTNTVAPPTDSIDEILEKVNSDIVLVDFHAEATAEKISFGYYLDGRVTAVIGTHTHVPTCDSRILPLGTAYQSDVGMVGSLEGVIGVKQDIAMYRFKTGLPTRFQPMETGLKQFNAIIIEVDDKTNKCKSLKQINLVY